MSTQEIQQSTYYITWTDCAKTKQSICVHSLSGVW